jgi:hypothetical protein
MCHDRGERPWVWQRESEQADDEPTEDADDELPAFLREEATTETELVTDGGDET